MNFALVGGKRNLMVSDYNKFRREEREREAGRTERRLDDAMKVPVVTQNTPGGGRVEPAAKDGAVSQSQLEQDVTATNPSVESMESRG